MRSLLLAAALVSPAAAQLPAAEQARSMPAMVAPAPPIPPSQDVAFPGTMRLSVDASDVTRGIFRVSQIIPVAPLSQTAPGRVTLLFPKWLPGAHAPRGQIEKIAGLVFTGNGRRLAWTRDLQDVFMFHVEFPMDTREIRADFQFLSATAIDQGRIVATADMLNLQPNSVSLYPAGYFTRRIPVQMSVTLPAGWQAATALRGARSGDTISYQTTDYDTLVDSPIFAGRWFRSWDLGRNVTLNVVADAERHLAATPAQIDAHRRLVDQAVKLWGGRRFDRYDFLLALTDQMGAIGLEHHRSSENGVNPGYFTEWDKGPGRRNLLPHEFTHSWNGKYRRAADSATPDFRTPIRNSLLWVYEGQTQFWGYVLGARSGLFTREETLDALAVIAATLDDRPGRQWRPLIDTTNDPIITPRAPKAWLSQQRSEDYYNEGMLIWLEADAIIRRDSKGLRGMDDVAKRFFAGADGDWGVAPYTRGDLIAALAAVQPHDWAGFLRDHVDAVTPRAPLGGFTLAGYALEFTDKPGPYQTDLMRTGKILDLSFSVGLVVGEGARVTQVIWGSPAYDAGITVGDVLVSVGDRPYADEALRLAVAARKPVALWVRAGDRVRDATLTYAGGLRYPRLVRRGGGPSSLDALLTAR